MYVGIEVWIALGHATAIKGRQIFLGDGEGRGQLASEALQIPPLRLGLVVTGHLSVRTFWQVCVPLYLRVAGL
jgi:hypothetical protein